MNYVKFDQVRKHWSMIKYRNIHQGVLQHIHAAWASLASQRTLRWHLKTKSYTGTVLRKADHQHFQNLLASLPQSEISVMAAWEIPWKQIWSWSDEFVVEVKRLWSRNAGWFQHSCIWKLLSVPESALVGIILTWHKLIVGCWSCRLPHSLRNRHSHSNLFLARRGYNTTWCKKLTS